MYLLHINIITLFFVNIFGSPTQYSSIESTSPKTFHKVKYDPTEICGDNCRSSPNILISIVVSLFVLFVVAIIAIFIIWYYLQQRNRKEKQIENKSSIKLFEQPSSYNGTSIPYGISLARNNSICSHDYETILYNERY